MQLAERHIIKRGDPRFATIDVAAFASKNLYNAAKNRERLGQRLRGGVALAASENRASVGL
jgi:hypothetical protein